MFGLLGSVYNSTGFNTLRTMCALMKFNSYMLLVANLANLYKMKQKT